MSDITNTQKKLLNAIIEADRNLAFEILMERANKDGFVKAFTDIFDPVLEQIGQLWNQNKLSLAQGYLAGKVAEDIFLEASSDHEYTKSTKRKGSVVIGNIEDDYHSLGRKLVGIFLKSAGWEVHDLGNDVEGKEFVKKAIETKSRVIGVSAMMYTTAKNITSVRKELDKQNLSGKIQLAVGGAVFKLRPGLVEEVGGDGTTDNAIHITSLFDQLWEKSLKHD